VCIETMRFTAEARSSKLKVIIKAFFKCYDPHFLGIQQTNKKYRDISFSEVC
jgi:hypothetical protein